MPRIGLHLPLALWALSAGGACTGKQETPVPDAAAELEKADPENSPVIEGVFQPKLVGIGKGGWFTDFEPKNTGPEVQLPKSQAYTLMSWGPAVVIAKDGIYLDGERHARVKTGRVHPDDVKGHLISGLDQALAQAIPKYKVDREKASGEEWFEHVVIFADQGTDFRTLVDTVYTAGQHGVLEYDLVVDAGSAPGGGGTVFRLEPPKMMDGNEANAHLAGKITKVFFMEDGVLFEGETLPLGPDLAAKLSLKAKARAESFKLPKGKFPYLIFSAENTLTLETIVGYLSGMVGPHCGVKAHFAADPKRCYFPNLIIEAGGA